MEFLKRRYEIARACCTLYLAQISQKSLALSLGSALLATALCYYLFAAPTSFVPGTVVRIEYGTSVPEITATLSEAHIIAHPTLFHILLRLSGASTSLQTGAYKFDSSQNVFTVLYRLIAGDYGLPPVRVTLVEGITAREAARQIAAALPGIDAADFLMRAQPFEGYLFPDTYFFQPSMDAASIVTKMRATFDKKVASLSGEITTSGHSLADIVVVASLIEKEARTSEARHMVSGILWNRLKLGMPLQVDAVFGYIFKRETYSPSYADLKVDSPYNTYTHAGLPPGPIANPGLSSIEAAINPTKSGYLFYLTGRDGKMHYATTYAAHLANQRKYLQ